MRALSKEMLAEVASLAERANDVVRARDVVEFARDETTALHRRFEWDDTKAAIQHRLRQARDILRVAVTILPYTNIEYRVFVSLLEDQKKADGGYRLTVDVLSDTERREALLKQAKGELRIFRNKYAVLVELAPVFAAIDKVAALEPEAKTAVAGGAGRGLAWRGEAKSRRGRRGGVWSGRPSRA